RAGAIGAAIAETMAEVSARAYDLEKTSKELSKEISQNGDQSEKALSLTEERNSIITKSVNIARFGTLGVAWLAQQDPSTAAFVGMMTVEHNFLDHLSLEMMANPEAARETAEEAQVARAWVHEKTGIDPAVVSILATMGPVGPLGELATMISRLTTAAENIGLTLKAGISASRVNPSGGTVEQIAPKPRGMHNPKVREAVERGQRAHAEFDKKILEKGWSHRPRLKDMETGRILKPDGRTPSGHYIELKPNTSSGRAQGLRQAEMYRKNVKGKKVRVIYYD
ncbi:MAG: hypothetical protein WCG05_05725, partial [Alphaproteobacteria bacterium]